MLSQVSKLLLCLLVAVSSGNETETVTETEHFQEPVRDSEQKTDDSFTEQCVVSSAVSGAIPDIEKERLDISELQWTEEMEGEYTTRCRDLHKDCQFWARTGECQKNADFMQTQCANACDTCSKQSTAVRLEQCSDELSDCKTRAAAGDCEKEPEFMRHRCLLACHWCFVEDRCPQWKKGVPSVRVSENGLISEARSVSEVRSLNHSSVHALLHSIANSEELVRDFGARLLQTEPPFVFFEHLISAQVADDFVALDAHNFQRSADAGELKNTGSGMGYEQLYSDYRTSQQSWCQGHCEEADASQSILRAFERVTGIPRRNYEQLQVLKYGEGKYYKNHHDFIQVQWDMICGPRILTFYLYLNDVDEGGETDFPQLGQRIAPKRGSAVLWPNVAPHSVFQRDERTEHSALPVAAGNLKYGTNAWIHLYEFRNAHDKGCTG